jgi:hypothetical protein
MVEEEDAKVQQNTGNPDNNEIESAPTNSPFPNCELNPNVFIVCARYVLVC